MHTNSEQLLIEYKKEVSQIEHFLSRNLLKLDTDLAPVFWNHMLSLLVRIDANEMNDMEIDDNFVPDAEAVDLTTQLGNELSKIRNFDVTKFEEFLLLLYIQRLLEERKKEYE